MEKNWPIGTFDQKVEVKNNVELNDCIAIRTKERRTKYREEKKKKKEGKKIPERRLIRIHAPSRSPLHNPREGGKSRSFNFSIKRVTHFRKGEGGKTSNERATRGKRERATVRTQRRRIKREKP